MHPLCMRPIRPILPHVLRFCSALQSVLASPLRVSAAAVHPQQRTDSGRCKFALEMACQSTCGLRTGQRLPSRPKFDEDDERAQSPGAHDAPSSGVPGSSNDGAGGVARAPSERSEGSSEVPHARPVPRRRAPPQQSADGVWISTSQGYAFHKIGCGKLNQSTGVTEVTRTVAIERGYRACRICKPDGC